MSRVSVIKRFLSTWHESGLLRRRSPHDPEDDDPVRDGGVHLQPLPQLVDDVGRDGEHGDADVAPLAAGGAAARRGVELAAVAPGLLGLAEELLGVVDGDGEGDACG